jgi:hypothetical protein
MQNKIKISDAPLTGTQLVGEINNALAAISTDFSGEVEPATLWGLMKWADTKNKILKIRNLDNTAWIDFMDLSTGKILTESTDIVLPATNADPANAKIGQVWLRTDL